MTFSLRTVSPEQSEALGAALAELLPKGTLVALYGNLAAGKTCFVRGMAARFGSVENVHSPTFTLLNIYGQAPRQLLHLDLYRLGSVEELYDLGCEELFESEDICVVEWAERAEKILPESRMDIYLEHGGGDIRHFRFEAKCSMPENWQVYLQKSL